MTAQDSAAGPDEGRAPADAGAPKRDELTRDDAAPDDAARDDAARDDADAAPDDAVPDTGQAAEPLVIRRRGRRVSTAPPPGYTGEPPAERKQSSENDARLRSDVPPHWGKR